MIDKSQLFAKKPYAELFFYPRICNAIYFRQNLKFYFICNIYYRRCPLASICEFLLKIPQDKFCKKATLFKHNKEMKGRIQHN